MSRRTRRWAVALTCLLGVGGVVGAYGVYRSLPMFSDAELREAEALLAAERAALAQVTCARAPVGDAEPTGPSAFEALLEGERWAECRRLASEPSIEEAVTNDDGHTWGWVIELGDEANYPPPVDPAQYMGSYAPPGRSEGIEAAERACDGLEQEIARLAATPDLCSPVTPSVDGCPPTDDVDSGLIEIAKAIGVRARRLAREGDTYAALDLLVTSLVVARDARRGAPTLIGAMLSVAAEGLLVRHALTLLMVDPGLEPSEYAALRAALVAIERAPMSPPHDMWRAERLELACVGEWASDGPFALEADAAEPVEQRDLMRMVAAHLDLSWCEEGASAASCLAAHRAWAGRTSVHVPAERLVWLGPRGAAADMLEWATGTWRQGMGSYLSRLLMADAVLGVLRAALAFSEARGLDDRCPPTLDEAALRVSTSDEPITIVHLDGAQYELQAPPLRAAAGFERPVATMACPAATAGWMDADDRPVAPADPGEPDEPEP